MRRQQAGLGPAAARHVTCGGQGVHREMESEGPASNLRAVAKAEAGANRSATSALIRARSLRAKEIPAERVQTHGVCGRHGGTEERLTWGDLVAFPRMVFMPPGEGRRAGGEGQAIRHTPKCLSDAQREIKGLIVAETCRESGAICAMAAQSAWASESGSTRCEGGPQERGLEGNATLSTEPEAR